MIAFDERLAGFDQRGLVQITRKGG